MDRQTLEKALTSGSLHNGTIKIQAKDVSNIMAELESFSTSDNLPNYDFADRYLTLKKIDLKNLNLNEEIDSHEEVSKDEGNKMITNVEENKQEDNTKNEEEIKKVQKKQIPGMPTNTVKKNMAACFKEQQELNKIDDDHHSSELDIEHSEKQQEKEETQEIPIYLSNTNSNVSTTAYVPAYLLGIEKHVSKQKESTPITTPSVSTNYVPAYLTNVYQTKDSNESTSNVNSNTQNTSSSSYYTSTSNTASTMGDVSTFSTSSAVNSTEASKYSTLQHQHDVPLDWECKKTQDGNVFYIDHVDQKTYWAPPNGWGISKNKDGRIFYLHHPTKTTHWELPPSGWEICQLPDGRIFYMDHVNKITSWTLPSA